MKVLNDFLTKVGTDKVLHFLVAYIMTIQFFLFTGSFEWCGFGCVITCMLAFGKEWVLDTDTGADVMDGFWSFVGAFLAFGQSVILSNLLNI